MWCYARAVQQGNFSILDFLNQAKSLRVDGVELLDYFYKDPKEERDSVKAKLEELELQCPIFSVANNFAKVDEDDRLNQLGKIKFGVDEALFYGAKIVRVFAGDVAEGMTYEQAQDWIISGLTQAADYAHDRGITLALENHGKLAGKGSQVRSIIQEVRDNCGHNALGANPDTGNFVLVDEDSVQACQEIGDMATMVHFKDFQIGEGPFVSLSGQKYQGAVIGEGLVDLTGCLSALARHGFNGWLSLEYEGAGDPIVEVRTSVQNARKIIECAEIFLN